MPTLSRKEYEQLRELHGLTKAFERSLPAARVGSIAAPECVRIDATWAPGAGDGANFAGARLRAESVARWMTPGAQYRVAGVLLPPRDTPVPVLWPHAIEALTVGRPINVARLQLCSKRAEPLDSTETAGTQYWEPAPRTASCDLLVGAYEDTTYVFVLRVLDARYVLDVHQQARGAWRRWFPEADPPSAFCLLEAEAYEGYVLGDPIEPFVPGRSLEGRVTALGEQMRRVINGRRNSIMHTVSILAIEGDEIAALSGGDRIQYRRAGADDATTLWFDPVMSELQRRARGEHVDPPPRATPGPNTRRTMSAPVTTRLAVGDQWRIETYRLPNKAALDAFRERPDDPVARAGAGPECSFALTMDVCHAALGANEHG